MKLIKLQEDLLIMFFSFGIKTQQRHIRNGGKIHDRLRMANLPCCEYLPVSKRKGRRNAGKKYLNHIRRWRFIIQFGTPYIPYLQILVHIPPSKKKNMRAVMNVIQERVKFPVGFAAYLYKMDGKRVRHPCEVSLFTQNLACIEINDKACIFSWKCTTTTL